MSWVVDRRNRLFVVGLLLILLGSLVASAIQTSGGIRIKDVRFTGTDGATMSALLYIPSNATAKTPAPGILAVHGYLNSRETQSGFAIEFARRGYVVLALDQTGHGYSDAPAIAHGFGGPDGLKYLRSLDIVDPANIGLEGHSMGGWTVLAAAAAYPDGYKALVLEGSSTGAPFAAAGTPKFPRNLALVYSKFDEFSPFMWGIPRAQDIAQSPKLWTLFDTHASVEVGKVYGAISDGNARILFTPGGTHPWDHLSRSAIGDSVEWFQHTLSGGMPLPADNQIWPWKELGTLIALVGLVVLLLGGFELLLRLPYFAVLAAAPAAASGRRGARWWGSFALIAAIPVLTYIPFLHLGELLMPPSHVFPQAFTNQIVVWALLNGIIGYLISLIPGGAKAQLGTEVGKSVAISLLTVGIGYLAVMLADFFFKIDFRFWIVAVKPLDLARSADFVVYLVPFTIFFLLLFRSLHSGLPANSDKPAMQYATSIAALAGGFAVFMAVQYGVLFMSGHLFSPLEGLAVIIGMQFVPLLGIVALIATFLFRRTNTYLPGALISSLFVTWYIAASQAVHIAR